MFERGGKVCRANSYIRPQLNKKLWEELMAYIPWYETDRIENDVSNNSSIVACLFVTAATFLPSRCLVTIGGFLPNQAVA
jgi:hypothetical protein